MLPAARRAATAAALLLALVLALPAGARTRPAADAAWTSYGHDDQLTNFVPARGFTVAAARRLGQAWTRTLDGGIVASPVAAPVGVDGLRTTVVYAATEGGSVYALDLATGATLWRRSFPTVATPGDACGTYGISSTPALDRARGLLYVIGAGGRLHALSLATGAEADGWPVTIVTRTGYEYVWGGLRVVGDTLYVPVSSYCDQSDPQGRAPEGRLVGIHLDDPGGPQALFDPVPGPDNLGGIWGWGGVSAERDGSFLYTGVGNSIAPDDACGCTVDTAGWGEQMVKLTPDLTTVVAADRPGDVAASGDQDFGAAPLLVRPPGCPPLAAANGKTGSLYLWNRDELAAGPLRTLPLSDGDFAFVGQPSWSPRTGMLYDAGATFFRGSTRLGNGVIALRVVAGCGLRAAWSAVTGDGTQPPPLVAGDLLFAAGGTAGGFSAYAARTGARLWRFSTGGSATLAPLVEVGGTVVGADYDGHLYAFRIAAGARRSVG